MATRNLESIGNVGPVWRAFAGDCGLRRGRRGADSGALGTHCGARAGTDSGGATANGRSGARDAGSDTGRARAGAEGYTASRACGDAASRARGYSDGDAAKVHSCGDGHNGGAHSGPWYNHDGASAAAVAGVHVSSGRSGNDHVEAGRLAERPGSSLQLI